MSLDDQYEVEVSIRKGLGQAYHLRMETQISAGIIPVHLQRRYMEHHMEELLKETFDRLFGPETRQS